METRKSGNLGISARSLLNFGMGVQICGRCVEDVAFAVLGDVLSASPFLVFVVFSPSDEF